MTQFINKERKHYWIKDYVLTKCGNHLPNFAILQFCLQPWYLMKFVHLILLFFCSRSWWCHASCGDDKEVSWTSSNIDWNTWIFQKNIVECGLKTTGLPKINKENFDYMFTIHPQKALGTISGRDKKEKRKSPFPTPQVTKQPKLSVKKRDELSLPLVFLSLYEVVQPPNL